MAISPDGETIALVARPSLEPSVAVRASRQCRSPTGGSRARTTRRSRSGPPTAAQLASSSAGRLKKVAVSGAPPQEIGAVEGAFYGGTWAETARFCLASSAGIRRVSAEGGAAETITKSNIPRAATTGRISCRTASGTCILAWSPEAAKRAIVSGALGSSDKTTTRDRSVQRPVRARLPGVPARRHGPRATVRRRARAGVGRAGPDHGRCWGQLFERARLLSRFSRRQLDLLPGCGHYRRQRACGGAAELAIRLARSTRPGVADGRRFRTTRRRGCIP